MIEYLYAYFKILAYVLLKNTNIVIIGRCIGTSIIIKQNFVFKSEFFREGKHPPCPKLLQVQQLQVLVRPHQLLIQVKGTRDLKG